MRHPVILGSLACLLVLAASAGAHTGGKLRPIRWARTTANTGVSIVAQNKDGKTITFRSGRTGAKCAGIGKAKVVHRVREWRHFGCSTQLLDGYGDNLQGVIDAYFQIHTLPPGTGVNFIVSNVSILSCLGNDCPVHR
jgi:hypothetical protein